jgi:DNA polymerase V
MNVSVVSVAAVAERLSKVTLPLYASRPAAGFPAPGDDMVEKALDLNELLIEHPVSTFFVRVEGDSMEGAQIFSGDILVVDKAREAHSGDIVVAAVYGELVVKRWVVKQGQAALVSENTAYEPIVVHEGGDVYLWGVVVGSVRRFV